MKSFATALVSVLLLAASGVTAAPAQQAQQAKQAEAINTNRRFYCPSKVQNFCSASNIHSGCTDSGEFRSDAMDTCGECKC
ncbi:hypothetical protein PLIIFM63780_003905 [Purpureocillium lilacinum]|uniref:Uncharacterized protein n=1 Tax=Purpureocillium lilacinum TaxID=33203 RepID=A0ACC4DBX2_PURLI|nr:hypothetical protein PLIIFM63780_003905 [Purpureocillium lilacinum]